MKTTRREFLGMIGFAVGTTAVFGLGGKMPTAIKEPIMRPPGVLDEDEFLSKCMRCKQCVYICQTDAKAGKVLFAGKLTDGLNEVNTPIRIEDEVNKCTACGLCATVCPSGAISKIVPQILADKCVGCFKCIPECPAEALSEGENGYPKLNQELCVGCAKCQDACKTIGQLAPDCAIEMVAPSALVGLPDKNPNRMAPQILAEKCVGCFKCIPHCPVQALSEGENGYPKLNPEVCIGCGDCLKACQTEGQLAPDFAIEMVPKDQLKPLPDTNPNRKHAHVKEAECQHCAKRPCVKACAYDAISYADKKAPAVVDPEKCVGCGECFKACPFEAIEMI